MRDTNTHGYVCAGTGPGTVQYDACHAVEVEVILQLRAEIEALRAQLAEARRQLARRAAEAP